MDELTQYLRSKYCSGSKNYNKNELEEILNKKIIITENHIKNIVLYKYYFDFNIINLFEKYGYIFTNNDYILLVKKDGYILKYIPIDNQTDEIYTYAVKQNGNALQFIPIDNQTDEIYTYAVKQTGHALQFIPEARKTKKICEIAVRQDGQALCYVPDDKKTNELCIIAVKQSKLALPYVSKHKNEYLWIFN